MAFCELVYICDRDALEGHSGRCILHSENSDKDVGDFEQALEEHRETHGPDFRGVVFPIENSFSVTTFEGRASFAAATFKGGAYFTGTTFEDGACFMGATFEGTADFTGATFKNKAGFTDATFEGVTHFKGATFKGVAHFGFGSPEDTIFEREANFGGVVFEDEAHFRSTTFEGIANFGFDVREGLTTFKGEADFGGATFKGEAHFRSTTFEEEAKFGLDVRERYATFKNVADFAAATFKGGAYFTGTAFEDVAYFTGTAFEDRVLFFGTSEANLLFAGEEVEFMNVTYALNTPPHFRYADLSQCRFLRTELRNIDFTGVQWCGEVSDDEWFRRVGVYDEIVERGKDIDEGTWADIERLYRQLKKNYEGRGDFPRAGDFHIGEKEARRRNPGTSGSMYLLLSTYRALSKYGERALPAFFWLVGIALACGAGYYLLDANPEGLTQSLSFSQALRYGFEVTLYPLESTSFEECWPWLLNVIQRIASPLLIALLALAIRQRVKR